MGTLRFSGYRNIPLNVSSQSNDMYHSNHSLHLYYFVTGNIFYDNGHRDIHIPPSYCTTALQHQLHCLITRICKPIGGRSISSSPGRQQGPTLEREYPLRAASWSNASTSNVRSHPFGHQQRLLLTWRSIVNSRRGVRNTL